MIAWFKPAIIAASLMCINSRNEGQTLGRQLGPSRQHYDWEVKFSDVVLKEVPGEAVEPPPLETVQI